MSLAKLIHKNKTNEVATAKVAIPAISTNAANPTVAKIARIAVAKPTNEKINRDIEEIKSWLIHIGEPEDHYLVIDKCKSDSETLAYYLACATECKREERRAKVLTMLAENPKTRRAFITDMDSKPDSVILTIAIRDVATFEMQISRDKYDPFMLLKLIEKGSIQ
ncbi:MAG: hypothetical protein WAU15_03615 [Nitrosomonas sp.]|jgi:hypothetical protein